MLIRPEYFRRRGIQFPVVFHEHSGQEFMFALEDVLQDAAQYLQDYYSQCPGGQPMQLVPVADPADLRHIAWKTAPGAAGSKHLNIDKEKLRLEFYEKPEERQGRDQDKDGGVDKFFALEDAPYPWVRLCCKEWMHDALDTIPTQDDSQPHNGWCCGVTSAAKAIHLFGNSMSTSKYRNDFLPNAPRLFTKKGAEEKGEGTLVAGGALMVASAILAPFTGGATIPGFIAGWGTAATGMGMAAVGQYAPSDSGVTPEDLAQHTTAYLPASKYAKHQSYDDFWACAKIIRDDMRRGDPVIAFWTYAATKAHYVNVVGVSVDTDDLPEDFMIMDTNNCLYRYHYPNMRALMKREFAFWVPIVGTDDYHIIRFYRS